MHCLIVDEHPVTLLGLRLLMQSNFPDWIVSATASIVKAPEFLEAVNGHSISLLLVGMTVLGEAGCGLLSQLGCHARAESIRSIVISSPNDDEEIAAIKRHGVQGHVRKSAGTAEIIRAVHIVCSGGEYFGSDRPHGPDLRSNCPAKLTSRQMELVELLFAGYSNKMIARSLNLSYGTVKNYMFDLMRVMSVKSRLELVSKIRERI